MMEMNDPVLMLGETVVEMVKAMRADTEVMRQELRDLVDAIRAMPAPVVNVTVPEPVVTVAPAVVQVDVQPAPVTVPKVQDIRITGLPPLRARVNRGSDGRIKSIEEAS